MMSFDSLSLGERIVLVARMATEAHLDQMREEENQSERWLTATAGGTGSIQRVTEDASSPDKSRAFNRARLAEGAAER